MNRSIEISRFSHFFIADTKSSWFWLIVRVYLGWEFLMAGWAKFTSAAWLGSSAGAGISGFVQGALAKTGGLHPDVQLWYASFLQTAVEAHPILWSYVITYGEIAVGLGLIFGCLTGVAAFFGIFMNLNFLLAGTVSVNPIMAFLGIGILLARRVSGRVGLDYWVRPLMNKCCKPKNGGQ